MTLKSLVDTIKQYLSLLFDRQWENWELLTIAAAATVLLIFMVATRRRKERAGFLHARHIPGRWPIIGARLSGGRQSSYGKRENVRRITKRLEESDAQVEQLRREIIGRDQAEARLVREISALTTINKQLQHDITKLTTDAERLQHKGRLSERSSEQTGAESAAVSEPLRREIAESIVADEQPRRTLDECGQANGMLRVSDEQTREAKRQSEPLDVEKLQAAAALAKQMQGRPRRA